MIAFDVHALVDGFKITSLVLDWATSSRAEVLVLGLHDAPDVLALEVGLKSIVGLDLLVHLLDDRLDTGFASNGIIELETAPDTLGFFLVLLKNGDELG